VVSGPVVNGGVPLRAGQRLVVNLPRAETVITADQGDEPVGAPDDAAPSAATPPARRAVANGAGAHAATKEAPAASSPAKGPSARRWAADLASGHWDRILADVERDGVNATLETATSEELFALADAARYRRRADLARAALLAHRRRFPHAARSLDALFLLGRAEELREHGSEAQAIAWYDEYLATAPTGAFAAEALGRKMILTNEMGGPAKARPIAREYLLRFPTGSYAGSARGLERTP
jgi:TolA-binding protein